MVLHHARLEERCHGLVKRRRILAAMELVQRDGAELDLDDDAERAEAESSGLKELHIVITICPHAIAIGEHDLEARHEP